MHKQFILRTIAIGALVLMTAGGLMFFSNEKTTSSVQIPVEQAPQEQTGDILLSIDGWRGEQIVSITTDETALEVLLLLDAEDPTLQLSTKAYAGLGTLVESMAEQHNGTDNKYWQYTINGEMPMVGADAYVLHDGDSIQWSFATSEF